MLSRDLLRYVKQGGSFETWPLGPGSKSPLLDEAGVSYPWHDNGRRLELLGGRELFVWQLLALVDPAQQDVQMVVVDPMAPGTKSGMTCGLHVDEQLRVITCPVKVSSWAGKLLLRNAYVCVFGGIKHSAPATHVVGRGRARCEGQ